MSPFSAMLLLWGIVVMAIAVWLAYGAFVVRRIVRNGQPLEAQGWMEPLWEIADRLELDEPPRLLKSSEAKMPFACGFITPVIVLPESCESWTPDRRRAVLLHELAHVRRRDLASHTLGRIACAVYWFHPLVWTAARKLRSESERACDDMALACGAKASDYAEHLLDIVTSVRQDSTPAIALAMARRKEFEGRMLAILDPELRHSSPSRRQSLALTGSLAFIALLVGAAAPAPRAAAIVVASSVPVATGTPAIDENFSPSDVEDEKRNASSDDADPVAARDPAAEGPKAFTDPVEEKNIENEAEKAGDASLFADDGAAARALVQLGWDKSERQKTGPDERPKLLANILLTDKDASLRKLAAWGLSEYADTPVATQALGHALLKDSDPAVREMAAWSLADGRRNSVAVTALMQALRTDASNEVRSIAAWSLGNLGSREAVPVLSEALSHSNKEVRARALWAIGNIGPKEAPPAVLLALRDPQPIMRQLAAWALYQIEDPASANALNAALQAETNAELRIEYIKALAAVGERSVDAIRGLLLSTDPKIKSMAVRALAGGGATGPWPWPWPEPRPFPR